MYLKIKCKIDWCKNHACRLGYCRRHYIQFAPKTQFKPAIKLVIKAPQKNDVFCTVPNCKYFASVKGYCALHYNRVRNGWSLDGTERANREGKKCVMVDCGRVLHAKSYCQYHYDKYWRKMKQDKCIVDGCHKIQEAKKLCSKHYWSLRDGRPLRHD